MASGKSKILKHIWEKGGGFIFKGENVTIVTNSHLNAVGIQVNDADVSVEFTIRQEQNKALLHGLIAKRGSFALNQILTGVCIEDRFYIPVNYRVKSVQHRGQTVDKFDILLAEHYEESKAGKKK